MSEKDEPTNGGSPPDPDAQEQLLKNQWEQMMQNYAKSGAMSATAPFMSGAMPFPMHFPQVRDLLATSFSADGAPPQLLNPHVLSLPLPAGIYVSNDAIRWDAVLPAHRSWGRH